MAEKTPENLPEEVDSENENNMLPEETQESSLPLEEDDYYSLLRINNKGESLGKKAFKNLVKDNYNVIYDEIVSNQGIDEQEKARLIEKLLKAKETFLDQEKRAQYDEGLEREQAEKKSLENGSSKGAVEERRSFSKEELIDLGSEALYRAAQLGEEREMLEEHEKIGKKKSENKKEKVYEGNVEDWKKQKSFVGRKKNKKTSKERDKKEFGEGIIEEERVALEKEEQEKLSKILSESMEEKYQRAYEENEKNRDLDENENQFNKEVSATEVNIHRIELALSSSEEILNNIVILSQEVIDESNRSKAGFYSTEQIIKIKQLAEEKLSRLNELSEKKNSILSALDEQAILEQTTNLAKKSEKFLEESVVLAKELKGYLKEEKWIRKINNILESGTEAIYQGSKLTGEALKVGAGMTLRTGAWGVKKAGRGSLWVAKKGLFWGGLGAAASAYTIVNKPIRYTWRTIKFLAKSFWNPLSNIENIEDLSKSSKNEIFNKIKEAWTAITGPDKKEKEKTK